jgi:hypothetical protein
MRQSSANSRVNAYAFSVPLTAHSGQQRQQNQSGHDAAKPKKANLAVSELEQLFKHPAPRGRRNQWQQPFNYQQQGQRLPETVAVHRGLLFGGRRYAVGGTTRAAHGLEEVGRRIEYQHVAFPTEAGLVGIQAAIELGKLGIPAK